MGLFLDLNCVVSTSVDNLCLLNDSKVDRLLPLLVRGRVRNFDCGLRELFLVDDHGREVDPSPVLSLWNDAWRTHELAGLRASLAQEVRLTRLCHMLLLLLLRHEKFLEASLIVGLEALTSLIPPVLCPSRRHIARRHERG